MAIQLADRVPHPDLWSVKFGILHFLEFALGVREGTFWGGNSFSQIRGQKPIEVAVKNFFYFLIIFDP